MRLAFRSFLVTALAAALCPAAEIAPAAFSPVAQVNTANVGVLGRAWTFAYPRRPGRAEAAPLIAGGVMYVPVGASGVCALDAAGGAIRWCGQYAPPARDPIADSNRGLAAYRGSLFMITSDGNLAAVEAASGKLRWKSRLAGYLQMPGPAPAPLAARDLVFVATRGHLEAFHVSNGVRAWVFSTKPEPDSGLDPSDTWTAVTGAYDASLDLLYWTYNASILALEPATGRIVWEFGFPTHEAEVDDDNQAPVPVDAVWHGEPRKLLVQANRNGFFYVLDRADGRLLLAKAFVRENQATRKIAVGAQVCPDAFGATSWQNAAYHPEAGLLYVIARDACARISMDGPRTDVQESLPVDSVKALDLQTGDIRWMYDFTPFSPRSHAGLLTTAGGLVFFGLGEGYVIAADASAGKILWTGRTAGHIRSAPVSYAAGGRQFVAVATSEAIEVFALSQAAPVQRAALRD